MSDEIKLEDSERQPCEVYSRIVGFMRPVQNWNKGKQQEFSEREMLKGYMKQINEEEPTDAVETKSV